MDSLKAFTGTIHWGPCYTSSNVSSYCVGLEKDTSLSTGLCTHFCSCGLSGASGDISPGGSHSSHSSSYFMGVVLSSQCSIPILMGPATLSACVCRLAASSAMPMEDLCPDPTSGSHIEYHLEEDVSPPSGCPVPCSISEFDSVN